MLSNVLKRCDLTIVTSTPSTLTTISDDSISTSTWQEMTIFEKVTVLRALCDARLNRADIEQVTEVKPSQKKRSCFSLERRCRICPLIRCVFNRSAKIREEIVIGTSTTRVCIAKFQRNRPSKSIVDGLLRSSICPFSVHRRGNAFVKH